MSFSPNYKITDRIASDLMRIESAKERAISLPLTLSVLSFLRETAKLMTTHYSTMIEGNALKFDEVKEVIEHEGHFPGRERDEAEVKGYYAALAEVERFASQKVKISEDIIQKLHAFVMSSGTPKVKKTQYRDSQNVIKDGRSGAIVYMPPEAKDVPKLMQEMVLWIGQSKNLPCPLVAAIVHCQFATIHPYYDGNGRIARLLTTLVLHLGGYDLNGIYSLEEYYAKDLPAYYKAISIGPSHNYYLGRCEADITDWVEYFCAGMVYSFEKVTQQMEKVGGEKTHSVLLRKLDPKQRGALELFRDYEVVTGGQIAERFGFKARMTSNMCRDWVESGFLEMVDPSKKARKYCLAQKYQTLI